MLDPRQLWGTGAHLLAESMRASASVLRAVADQLDPRARADEEPAPNVASAPPVSASVSAPISSLVAGESPGDVSVEPAGEQATRESIDAALDRARRQYESLTKRPPR